MKLSEVIAGYPAVDRAKVKELLKNEVDRSDVKLVVLDDDPTGTQTVHGIRVYTDWSIENIRHGFAQKEPLFFLLTNSRAMQEEETILAHTQIAERVMEVSASERPFMMFSRSDSTLRGHFPLETEILKRVMEAKGSSAIDGEILCPYFRQGGRYTVDHVHYVAMQGEMIPAAETEFARDATFGYKNSDLFAYVEEKTKGSFTADSCLEIPLSMIRAMKFDEIEAILLKAEGFQKIIVNALDDVDVEIFSIALYRALAKGKHFIARTAAGLVKAMGNISDKELLTREELKNKENKNGGVIVAGSYTEKTTKQLERLKSREEIKFIELNSDLVLDPEAFEEEIKRVQELEENLIVSGKTVCVYTKRKQLRRENDRPEEILARSVRISEGLQRCVGELKAVPSFVVAKGGITSSDVGIKALKVSQTVVAGQIMPGVSVWITGEESTFPGIPYVIFPGNVGDVDTLYEAVAKLL